VLSAVRAAQDKDKWSAARVLAKAFDGQQLYYLSSLQAPGLESNVFFKSIDQPVIAVAEASDGSLTGVAQLLRVKLSEVASTQSPPAVAFIQNVAVAQAARRQGVARALMEWSEQRACAGWPDVSEAWLAVAVDNDAALGLYAALGYERRGERMGNVLMSKTLAGPAASSLTAAEPAIAASAPATPPTRVEQQPKVGGMFSGLLGGLASALESVLEAGFPGQLALLQLAERELQQSARVVDLLGADVSIGEVDTKESMSVSAGVQIIAQVSGSKGSGTVTIGGARQDEDEDGALSLEVLRVQVGEEDFFVVEP